MRSAPWWRRFFHDLSHQNDGVSGMRGVHAEDVWVRPHDLRLWPALVLGLRGRGGSATEIHDHIGEMHHDDSDRILNWFDENTDEEDAY